jgi:hypothetical protein
MTDAIRRLADRLDVLREIEQLDHDLAQFVERHGPTPEVTELRSRQQRARTRVLLQVQVAAVALAYVESSALIPQ